MERKKKVVIVLVILIVGVVFWGIARRYYETLGLEYITVDGLERSYRVYVPTSIDDNEDVPLVIALHGGGGTSQGMMRLTENRFNELADSEKFIVVYPDAIEKNWNDGRGLEDYYSQRENVDDVGFISTLIDTLAGQYNIDRSRVYVTGISNGALMSFRLACEIPEKIAAIAPVAGSMLENFSDIFTPSLPMPVLMINGIEDPLVPWGGGAIHFGDRELGNVISVEESIDFWVDYDNCTSNTTRVWLPDLDPDDGTRVYKEVHGNGTGGTEVILIAIEGGGHTWPGGFQYLSESLIGKTSRDIDACELIWSFFNNHTRQVAASNSYLADSTEEMITGLDTALESIVVTDRNTSEQNR